VSTFDDAAKIFASRKTGVPVDAIQSVDFEVGTIYWSTLTGDETTIEVVAWRYPVEGRIVPHSARLSYDLGDTIREVLEIAAELDPNDPPIHCRDCDVSWPCDTHRKDPT
jgi:hypothetical protein